MNLNDKKYKLDIEIKKKCSVCDEEKNLNEFYETKRHCKKCEQNYSIKYKAKNIKTKHRIQKTIDRFKNVNT